MFSRRLRWFSIGLTVAVIVAVSVAAFMPARVSITGGGTLSLESRVAIAAQTGIMGNGEPVPQQIGEIFRRGGPPVVGIFFSDPVDLDNDALYIDFSQGLPDAHVSKRDFTETKPGEREAEREAEAEGRCKDRVNQSLEILVLVSDICDLYSDDPVCQDPPILLDNERIEKVKGKYYLVTAIAYFDVHIYSFDPLKFTVRINGLDAGPVIGEWWLE